MHTTHPTQRTRAQQSGMATSEYAVGVLGACLIAAILYALVPEIREYVMHAFRMTHYFVIPQ